GEQQDVFLGAGVMIDRARAHPRPGGHLLHGRAIETLLGEKLDRRLDDLFPALLDEGDVGYLGANIRAVDRPSAGLAPGPAHRSVAPEAADGRPITRRGACGMTVPASTIAPIPAFTGVT